MKTLFFLFLAAQGADLEMKRLMDLEAQPPDTAPGKVGLGDSYMEAAKKFPKDHKRFEDRGVQWYAKAWPDLDAVWKEKLRVRLHKLAGLPEGWDKAAKGAGAARGWSIPDELWGAHLMQGFGHGSRTCAQILPAGKKNEAGYTGFHCSTIQTSEGKKYKLSLWAFTNLTDADGTCYVRFFDASGKLLKQSGPFIPPDSPWWQKLEAEYVAPSGAARVDLNFTMNSKAGATFIDDVSIELDGKNLIQNGDFEMKP